MCLKLVTLQVHLRLEYDKFLFQALLVQADEMVLLKMVLKCVVIDVVLLLTVRRTSVTNVATLVLVTTMSVKLIVAVESLATKATLGVSLEATLIYGTWLVVTRLLVLAQFGWGEQFMLMSEHLLVPSTKVTVPHDKLLVSKVHHIARLTYHIALPCLFFT
jgi:hypothetical protein